MAKVYGILIKKMKREEEHLLKNMLKDDCKGKKRGKSECRAQDIGEDCRLKG